VNPQIHTIHQCSTESFRLRCMLRNWQNDEKAKPCWEEGCSWFCLPMNRGWFGVHPSGCSGAKGTLKRGHQTLTWEGSWSQCAFIESWRLPMILPWQLQLVLFSTSREFPAPGCFMAAERPGRVAARWCRLRGTADNPGKASPRARPRAGATSTGRTSAPGIGSAASSQSLGTGKNR
jgi:hypothetical protein